MPVFEVDGEPLWCKARLGSFNDLVPSNGSGRFGERLVAGNRWVATGGQIKRDEGKKAVFIYQSSGSSKSCLHCISDRVL